MNRRFTPQEQQRLNSTGMCDDSTVLGDGRYKNKGSFYASRINYEALNYLTLLPIDRFDKVARGSGEGSEDRIHFIRKPVEIKEFIQRVTKELEQGILGIEKTRCYNEIEFKQTRQQQY